MNQEVRGENQGEDSKGESMNLKEQITKKASGLRIWHQERTILETTELMCEVMEEEGISRAELAKRMKVTRGFVTQLLDGTANMTLRTVSDVFVALGRQFHPAQSPLSPPEICTIYVKD